MPLRLTADPWDLLRATGVWAFPAIIADFPEGPKQTSGPFWVGSGLAFASALIALFLIPEIPTDGMTLEDERFREYLALNGYDVSQMGTHSELPSDDLAYEAEKPTYADMEQKAAGRNTYRIE